MRGIEGNTDLRLLTEAVGASGVVASRNRYVMLLRSSATRDGLHSIVSESEVLSVTWAALGAFGIGLT